MQVRYSFIENTGKPKSHKKTLKSDLMGSFRKVPSSILGNHWTGNKVLVQVDLLILILADVKVKLSIYYLFCHHVKLCWASLDIPNAMIYGLKEINQERFEKNL